MIPGLPGHGDLPRDLRVREDLDRRRERLRAAASCELLQASRSGSKVDEADVESDLLDHAFQRRTAEPYPAASNGSMTRAVRVALPQPRPQKHRGRPRGHPEHAPAVAVRRISKDRMSFGAAPVRADSQPLRQGVSAGTVLADLPEDEIDSILRSSFLCLKRATSAPTPGQSTNVATPSTPTPSPEGLGSHWSRLPGLRSTSQAS